MIPANIIDDIRYRCDIESVISSYITLKKAGSRYKGLCPFHSEKTPSFVVYPETQSFYCFGCGAGGDVISFIMRAENLDYVSAVETLAKRAGIALPDFDKAPERVDTVSRQRVLAMNLEAAKYYRKMLFDENKGAPGRAYLAERGISQMAIKRFGLGYSPRTGGSMLGHLKSLGFSEKEIHTAYFSGKNEKGYYDYFRGRIMYPIIDVSGNVIAFGGRVLDDSKPKYLNTSDTPAFKKSKNLFALNYAKNSDAGYFILCEGYMDVISLHDAGFGMAVATLGTAITAEQCRVIKKYTGRVIISYDSDEAGQKAASRAIPMLEEAVLEAKVLKVTGAKDPDEFIKKFGAEKFRSLIEKSRSKYDFAVDEALSKHNIEDAAEKIKALSEICAFIAGIHSNVERDIYIEKTSKTFSIDRTSIKNDVETKRRKNASEYDKKRKGELIRITSGIGDRVNPDFAKKPRAARLEESVLGMIFIHPEYINRKTDGIALSEEDFFTSFGKRIFTFIRNNLSDGNFSQGMLNEECTPDEISRIYKITAERNELSVNDETSFDTYLRALREEMKKGSDSAESLEEYLLKKRGSLKDT